MVCLIVDLIMCGLSIFFNLVFSYLVIEVADYTVRSSFMIFIIIFSVCTSLVRIINKYKFFSNGG